MRKKKRIKKNKNINETDKSFKEYVEDLRRLIIETLNFVQGFSYDNVLNLTMRELLLWHERGLEVYKNLHGIK